MIRRLADGTVTDGTAEWIPGPEGEGFRVRDFRDLDGVPMALPPGAAFEFDPL